MSRKNGNRHWKHANPAMAEALRDLKSSGAAGPHQDRRERRRRTRGADRGHAVQDSYASA